jgi:hypothetical protein
MTNWKEYFHEKRKYYIYWKNTFYVRFLQFFKNKSKIFRKYEDDDDEDELIFNIY